MQEALESIYTRFVADADLSGAVTGMWQTEAPPKTVFPYITTHLVSNNPLWVFPAKAMENLLIQFSIFSDTVADTEVNRIYRYLTVAYDNVNLTVCGHACVMMKRENAGLMRNDEVWQYAVTYRLMAQAR